MSSMALSSKLGEVLLRRKTLTAAVQETQGANSSSFFANEIDADMINPDLQLHVLVYEEDVLMILPILRSPAPRAVVTLKEIGLDWRVCWAMAKTANIQEKDLILDPMCGKGTLLLAAAESWGKSGQKFVGWDNSSKQIDSFDANLKRRELAVVDWGRRIASASNWSNKENAPVLQGCRPSCFYVEQKNTSLQEKIVTFFNQTNLKANVVLCDLPYGKQFGSVEENKLLYPEFCDFLTCILAKDNGRFVLITSDDNVELLTNSLLQLKQHLVIAERRKLFLHGHPACIFSGRIRGNEEELPEGFVPKISNRLAWEPKKGGRALWTSHQANLRDKLQPC